MSFLFIATLIVLVEVGLYLVVTIQRKKFQWIITEKDELPTFDKQALKKFFDYSFDPKLGWVRKPNSGGTENGINGPINFFIDSTGSRASRFDKWPSIIAAFGDSYAFCRQVEDDQTWEAQLSEQQGFSVMNFGVGNYGVDQALLRYEGMVLPETVRVVVMGFVPETICRIQSYWKHYLEFGNTFAFKPRFYLEADGEMKLLENPIRSIEDFSKLPEKLPEIREHDGFYYKKFRSLQFRIPYIASLMRNPQKQFSLISSVALRGILRTIGISSEWIRNLPFMLVMKSNIRDSHKLYRDDISTKLLSAILLRFNDAAAARGHIPLVVVMPQLLDLKLTRKESIPYRDFFLELAKQVSVLDLTEVFSETDLEKLYVNDQYGGHLSVEGNRLVSESIASWLRKNNVIKQL